MSAMAVEQAVFASSDRGAIKGYQLIAQSAGINRQARDVLSRWAPTRLLDEDPEAWIISGFPLCDNTYAVARTVLGGPEYSGRGGTQVVTLFLLLNDQQYEAYGFDPLSVAANALAMGWMRLPMHLAHETLPQVLLPALPIAYPPKHNRHAVAGNGTGKRSAGDSAYERYSRLLDEIIDLLKDDQRVAVIGVPDPVVAAADLVARMPEDSRKSLNLTTGLTTSIRRPFNVQFFTTRDSFHGSSREASRKQLGETQEIAYVEF